MPYIPQEDREEAAIAPVDSGELNFAITSLVNEWLGMAPRYDAFNSAIGVLECAKLELYRRMVAPYEDKACAKNGDVYLR